MPLPPPHQSSVPAPTSPSSGERQAWKGGPHGPAVSGRPVVSLAVAEGLLVPVDEGDPVGLADGEADAVEEGDRVRAAEGVAVGGA